MAAESRVTRPGPLARPLSRRLDRNTVSLGELPATNPPVRVVLHSASLVLVVTCPAGCHGYPLNPPRRRDDVTISPCKGPNSRFFPNGSRPFSTSTGPAPNPKPTKHPHLQHFPTNPKPSQHHPPTTPSLPVFPQITSTTYDYNNDSPKRLWHIGTTMCKTACGRAGRGHKCSSPGSGSSRRGWEVGGCVDDFPVVAVEHRLLREDRQ